MNGVTAPYGKKSHTGAQGSGLLLGQGLEIVLANGPHKSAQGMHQENPVASSKEKGCNGSSARISWSTGKVKVTQDGQ